MLNKTPFLWKTTYIYIYKIELFIHEFIKILVLKGVSLSSSTAHLYIFEIIFYILHLYKLSFDPKSTASFSTLHMSAHAPINFYRNNVDRRQEEDWYRTQDQKCFHTGKCLDSTNTFQNKTIKMLELLLISKTNS